MPTRTLLPCSPLSLSLSFAECKIANFAESSDHVKATNRKFVGLMSFIGFILVANEQSDIYQHLCLHYPFVPRLTDQTGKMGEMVQ